MARHTVGNRPAETEYLIEGGELPAGFKELGYENVQGVPSPEFCQELIGLLKKMATELTFKQNEISGIEGKGTGELEITTPTGKFQFQDIGGTIFQITFDRKAGNLKLRSSFVLDTQNHKLTLGDREIVQNKKKPGESKEIEAVGRLEKGKGIDRIDLLQLLQYLEGKEPLKDEFRTEARTASKNEKGRIEKELDKEAELAKLGLMSKDLQAAREEIRTKVAHIDELNAQVQNLNDDGTETDNHIAQLKSSRTRWRIAAVLAAALGLGGIAATATTTGAAAAWFLSKEDDSTQSVPPTPPTP